MAGFVDAIVGGGGLIQLPAMMILLPSLSLPQIMATNKTANFFGTSLAAYRYSKKVQVNWSILSPAMVFAFIGSYGGALLVSHIHKDDFMPYIIVALVVVLIYTIFSSKLGLEHKEKNLSGTTYYLLSLLIGGCIGFYDGLIGPGTGSFMIFAFIMLFGYNFLYASANAKILNCVTNIAALIFFLAKGFVLWSYAIPIGLANMAGSYTGSHLALKKGSSFIRIFFIIVVIALIVKLSSTYVLPLIKVHYN
jgi:hypothetical protein